MLRILMEYNCAAALTLQSAMHLGAKESERMKRNFIFHMYLCFVDHISSFILPAEKECDKKFRNLWGIISKTLVQFTIPLSFELITSFRERNIVKIANFV